ncbi:pirin family protein [Naumannella halotolerans]|uniref:Pirin n=1 Tax=Naumannella halotolerans TaxID=993414 RepID=A0A4R7J5K1_9ACTN|nr:pirin family protein [Naumannella halotolerans]TDT32631.1 pirin [Naumannella halotolerans]
MSNLETRPDEVVCHSDGLSGPSSKEGGRAPVEIITARDVPLGGPRSMTVRRTLPQRQRSLIGAWCFVDHYGPDQVETTGGMDVAPHPHTGLQTVSWLFNRPSSRRRRFDPLPGFTGKCLFGPSIGRGRPGGCG